MILGVGDTRRKLASFTMVELLVVMAIIVLLVALLVPALGRVRARARAAQCVNNLHQLHLAYANLAQDKGGGSGSLSRHPNMTGWPVMWLHALKGNRAAFVCPDDKTPTSLVAEAILDLYEDSPPGQWTYLYSRGLQEFGGTMVLYGDTIWTNFWPFTVYLPFANLLQLRDYGSLSNPPAYAGHISLPNGYYYRFWLDSNIADAGLVGYSTAGSNATLVGGAGWPAIQTSGGTVNLGLWQRGMAYRYDLRDAGGNLLVTNLTRANGSSVVVPLLATSYGLNVRAAVPEIPANRWFWPVGGEKILLLDFPKPDCMVRQIRPNQWSTVIEPWSPWQNPDGSYTFGRHNGRCNVLFSSGRVEAFKPQEIDPNISVNLTNYWLPIGGDGSL